MRVGSLFAAVFLVLVAIGHALRLALGVSVTIGSTSIPAWVSLLGVAIPLMIAALMWRETTRVNFPLVRVRELTLADWANIGEVIGAIAVVISLVYVGIQIRESTEEMRATNRQQLISRAHEATARFALSSELSAVLAKVAIGDPLTGGEQVQYGYLIRSMLYDVQEALVLNREGRLDDAYWETRAVVARSYMSSPQARSVYQREKALGTLLPDFVAWMDESILQ